MEQERVLCVSKTVRCSWMERHLNFVKFSDEQEVSVNLIEDGKIVGHILKSVTPSISEILSLKLGEKIVAEDGVITCIEDCEEYL